MGRIHVGLVTLGCAVLAWVQAGAQEVDFEVTRSLGHRARMPVGARVHRPFIALDPTGPVTIDPHRAAATVVVFVAWACPFSRSYHSYLRTLYRAYVHRNVQFVFLDATVEDSVGEGGKWLLLRDSAAADAKPQEYIGVPAVYVDFQSEIARFLGATHTPETFIFDSTGTLRYTGSLTPLARDDKPERSTKPYARWALDAILAGQPLVVTQTPSFGCHVHSGTPDGDEEN